MTKYVVLKFDAPDSWNVVQSIEAAGSEQAIRKTATGDTGTYVAIPERSFQPQKVSVKQREPIITISPA